jgi:hypothetical protein
MASQFVESVNQTKQPNKEPTSPGLFAFFVACVGAAAFQDHLKGLSHEPSTMTFNHRCVLTLATEKTQHRRMHMRTIAALWPVYWSVNAWHSTAQHSTAA